MTLQRGIPVKKCPACQGNRHINCDLHVNDGVSDHREFADVACECPCEGEVFERDGLIKLVGELRRQIRMTHEKYTDQRIARDRNNQRWFEKWIPVAELIEDLLRPDDEGNVLLDRACSARSADLQQAWAELREEMR